MKSVIILSLLILSCGSLARADVNVVNNSIIVNEVAYTVINYASPEKLAGEPFLSTVDLDCLSQNFASSRPGYQVSESKISEWTIACRPTVNTGCHLVATRPNMECFQKAQSMTSQNPNVSALIKACKDQLFLCNAY